MPKQQAKVRKIVKIANTLITLIIINVILEEALRARLANCKQTKFHFRMIEHQTFKSCESNVKVRNFEGGFMAIIFKHCRGYFHKYILLTMMENLHSSLHLLRFRQDWETFTNTYSNTYHTTYSKAVYSR